VIFVDEPNTYRCVFQSRKPNSEKFQDWVFEEVLPTIRQTGKYSIHSRDNRIIQIAANISMRVIPSDRHEFLVTTKEFARAIDVPENNIRSNKSRRNFKEDVHFIDNFRVYDDETKLEVCCTVWTKKGVIGHAGFFRTGYGKELRAWAINQGEAVLLPAGNPVKRRHNRITNERMIDILASVSRVPDNELRAEIINKLMGGYPEGGAL